MKCFRCFSFALFALLGVFFGSFIINQNNTYALEDLVINSPFSTGYYCSNTSSSVPNCGYHYIVTSCSGLSIYNSDAYIQPYINYNGLGANYRIYPFFNSVLDFSNNPIDSFNIGSVSGFPSDYNCSITLTDNSPFSGIIPSGSLEITENGTYDVTNYAEAVVNVPETDCPPGSGGNYHDDLVAINNSIMICAATCLVIYFFYCIYRMIIKNSGVK